MLYVFESPQAQHTHRRLLELHNLGNSSKGSQGWSIHVIANCNDGSAERLCPLLCFLLGLKWIGFCIYVGLFILLMTGFFACNKDTIDINQITDTLYILESHALPNAVDVYQ